MELKGYILLILLGQAGFLGFVIWSYLKEYRERFMKSGRYKIATIVGVAIASLALSTLITGFFVMMLGK
jgi:hypothetical protein